MEEEHNEQFILLIELSSLFSPQLFTDTAVSADTLCKYIATHKLIEIHLSQTARKSPVPDHPCQHLSSSDPWTTRGLFARQQGVFQQIFLTNAHTLARK